MSPDLKFPSPKASTTINKSVGFVSSPSSHSQSSKKKMVDEGKKVENPSAPAASAQVVKGKNPCDPNFASAAKAQLKGKNPCAPNSAPATAAGGPRNPFRLSASGNNTYLSSLERSRLDWFAQNMPIIKEHDDADDPPIADRRRRTGDPKPEIGVVKHYPIRVMTAKAEDAAATVMFFCMDFYGFFIIALLFDETSTLPVVFFDEAMTQVAGTECEKLVVIEGYAEPKKITEPLLAIIGQEKIFYFCFRPNDDAIIQQTLPLQPVKSDQIQQLICSDCRSPVISDQPFVISGLHQNRLRLEWLAQGRRPLLEEGDDPPMIPARRRRTGNPKPKVEIGVFYYPAVKARVMTVKEDDDAAAAAAAPGGARGEVRRDCWPIDNPTPPTA
ncbi:hypothetical protein SSX86_008657 [Deinandra increscens subsp. villosa]|uniref:Uncharacterized protein n=1 Tax=Deinandra increscens subsp. villosa TaxID=3103831 RepID=A0AAP0H709_9ASTR